MGETLPSPQPVQSTGALVYEYVVNADPSVANLPSVYATIQTAITAAETDIGVSATYKQPVILVTPGDYFENLVIRKKIHIYGMNAGSGSTAVSVKIKMNTAAVELKSGCTLQNLGFERNVATAAAVGCVRLDAAAGITVDTDTDNPNTQVNIINCTFNSLNSTSTEPVISMGTLQPSPCVMNIKNSRVIGTGYSVHVGGSNSVYVNNCEDFEGRIVIDSITTNALRMQGSSLFGDIVIVGGVAYAGATQVLYMYNSRIITTGNISSINVDKIYSNIRLENIIFYNSSNVEALIDITTTSSIVHYANLVFNKHVSGGSYPDVNDVINSNGTGSTPVAIDVVPTITP
jgi:hypothetical protein